MEEPAGCQSSVGQSPRLCVPLDLYQEHCQWYDWAQIWRVDKVQTEGSHVVEQEGHLGGEIGEMDLCPKYNQIWYSSTKNAHEDWHNSIAEGYGSSVGPHFDEQTICE